MRMIQRKTIRARLTYVGCLERLSPHLLRILTEEPLLRSTLMVCEYRVNILLITLVLTLGLLSAGDREGTPGICRGFWEQIGGIEKVNERVLRIDERSGAPR